MLLAAADPVGDATLVWRAAERLGIGPARSRRPRTTGCWRSARGCRFRHPLVRSAVYRAASPRGPPARARGAGRGRPIPSADADRRAWHRALAAAGPDEDVAAELERSAGRAQARGGLAAAAAFLERAAALTPDPAHRARRALAAAQAKHQAGAPDAALALLASAEAGPLDELAARPGRACCAREIAFALEPRQRRARRCCSRPRGSSSRSTWRSRARPTWRR